MVSVSTGERQAAFCATFVDEFVRAGVTDAVVCPGSRSTPMALALRASELRLHVRLDERSAGFFALGIARATSRPVVILVTSGTAVAELHAAVAEASLDAVPLVVLSADRPPELHHIGAPQTMAQADVFGSLPRFSVHLSPAFALDTVAWRSEASRLIVEATGVSGLPGPVHANVGFVDPLVSAPGPVPEGMPDGAPWMTIVRPDVAVPSLDPLLRGRRGVLVVGADGGERHSVLRAARSLGWPILADPRSSLRVADPAIVTTGDALLRDPRLAERLTPEVIVSTGAPAASKVLSEWMAGHATAGVPVIRIGIDGPARHPTRTSATFVLGDATSVFASLAGEGIPVDPSWQLLWRTLDDAAQRAIDACVGPSALSEPSIARAISMLDGDAVTVVVASSMPLRDLEWYGSRQSSPQTVLANRGVNGIDGVVSTAMGVSSSGIGPVVALVGDLAFLHDVSALVDGVEEPGSLVIVVVDNGGGGIFSFLPQRNVLDHEVFERLFGTPRTPSPADVASGFGYDAVTVTDSPALTKALDERIGRPGVHVVVCSAPTRDANVSFHGDINNAICAAGLDAID